MNQFVVHLVGVVFYLITSTDGVSNARQAYLIDARNGVTYGGQTIAPHLAYVVVGTDSIVQTGTTWQADGTFSVDSKTYSYFELDGETLTVNALQTVSNAGQPILDSTNHDNGTPRVTQWCPGWSPNLAAVAIAGRLDITTGKLEAAGDVNLDEGVTSSWTFDVNGNLVLTATKTGVTKGIEITKGAEIEIGVATEGVMRRSFERESRTNHFLLFYSMGHTASGDECNVALYPGSGARMRTGGGRSSTPAASVGHQHSQLSPAHQLVNQRAKNTRSPRKTKPPRVTRRPSRNLHADCSNSVYP